MSRLVEQIKQAVAAFTGCKTTPALIGGLALAAHQVVRATRDVDFLADADDADRLHDIPLTLGYRCVHRSEMRPTMSVTTKDWTCSMRTAPSRGACLQRPLSATP